MDGNEGSGADPPNPKVRKRNIGADAEDHVGGGEESDSINYAPYFKPNYKRLYPEHSGSTEFKVFVESQDKERLGNKSPIYLNHIFAADVKGVVAIRRVNANKIVVVFKQYNTANNFINNVTFLEKYKMRAYIPAAQIERVGIIRFVPTNISNKELYTKLSSVYEIVAIRRFTKKVGQNLNRVPLQTVSITFLANSLPDSIQYDLFSYRVFDYIQPLLQCYRCFKFNHSANICNGKQRCSCCAGEHSYKECDKPNELCCINCSGPHLAISRTCPVKLRKMLEKKEKVTYANIANTNNTKKETDFPALPDRSKTALNKKENVNNVNKELVLNKNKIKLYNVDSVHNTPKNKETMPEKKTAPKPNIQAQIIANNDVLMALVHTLVQLSNKSDDVPITTSSIKEMLIKNLIT